MDKEMEDLRTRKVIEVGEYLFEKYGVTFPPATVWAAEYLTRIDTEYWWNKHKDDAPEALLKAAANHAQVIAEANRKEAKAGGRISTGD